MTCFAARRWPFGIAAIVLVGLAACGGETSGNDLRVSFGYADSGYAQNGVQAHQNPAPGRYPAPWQGAKNVNFVGQGPSFDSGAIRIENPSAKPVTVERAVVDVGDKHYDLWGRNLTVPAHGSLLLTQTDMNPQAGPNGQPTIEPNFDTSEKTAAPGTSTPSRPVLHLTVGGRTTDVRDEHKVLTNNGRDLGAETGNPNESAPWSFAGTVAVEDEVAGANPLGAAALAALLVSLLGSLPALIGALLLLVVGWLLARWLARVVALVLARAGLDAAVERAGLVPAELHGPAHAPTTAGGERGHPHRGSAAWLLGVLVGGIVFLVFAIAAAEAVGLATLSTLLNAFVGWLPNLLVAIVLVGLGLLAARWLSGLVYAAARAAGLPAGMLALLVRVLVILVAAVAALEHLGVAGQLAQALFTGLCIALALAVGLAFGLGGEETARQMLERWRGGRPQLG